MFLEAVYRGLCGVTLVDVCANKIKRGGFRSPEAPELRIMFEWLVRLPASRRRPRFSWTCSRAFA